MLLPVRSLASKFSILHAGRLGKTSVLSVLPARYTSPSLSLIQGKVTPFFSFPEPDMAFF